MRLMTCIYSLLLTFWFAQLTLGLNSTSPSGNSSSLIQSQYNSRNFHYKGVALGGWLILEPYITPSLFLEFNKTSGKDSDIPIDEHAYCKKLGYKEAKNRLTKHWDTFYNESDFAQIKEYGLNMVRIPIGYWAFEKLENDSYVPGAEKYLDQAIEWAYKYNLKVWVDLHGLPGSQNGFDNSGLRSLDYPGWFNRTEHVDLSHRVLNKIYSKYGGHNMSTEYKDTILGIEVVNEPLGPKLSMKKVKKFYEDSYGNARKIQAVNNTIVFHDAFQLMGYWNKFLSYSGNKTNSTIDNYNILVDHHHYEVFSLGALNLTIDGHLLSIKSFSSSIKDENKHHPAVVGEWLAALTDCTPWLNGVGIGTRFEGTSPYTNDKIGTCDDINTWGKWSKEQKKNYRKFVEMQLDQYSSKMNGWIFWCFKTETSMEWDFKRLVHFDLMPQPLDDRKYIVNGTDTDEGDDKKSIASTTRHRNIWLLLVTFGLQLVNVLSDQY